MKEVIRVIIADDHEIVREGMAEILENDAGIELVAMASNGEDLVSLVKLHRPDVVVTDIKMEPMDGITATRLIKNSSPETAVIAVTAFADNYAIIDMLGAGATGYLGKNASKHMILEAIKAAHAGKNYFCKTSSEIISALVTERRYDPNKHVPLDFTPTELRILRDLCNGKDAAKIGEELQVTAKTVLNYKSKIMEKAEVNTSSELILYAIRNGIYRP